jgi:hypothetical protein
MSFLRRHWLSMLSLMIATLVFLVPFGFIIFDSGEVSAGGIIARFLLAH